MQMGFGGQEESDINVGKKFSIVENMEEPRILTKWIVTEKVDEGDMNRVKARLVVMGNMEEGLPSIQTQSPTYGKDMVRMLLAVASS